MKTKRLTAAQALVEFLGCQIPELKEALAKARRHSRTTVIVIETDPQKCLPGFESWWDVPIAEVSSISPVKTAREQYEEARTRQRYHLSTNRGNPKSEYRNPKQSEKISNQK